MAEPELRHFASFDGTELAYREVGEGARAVVLLHGLFSSGSMNWLKYGHADAIAARGFRVVVPDLRAHGRSAKPHEPNAYPPNVLVHDAVALVAHLGLTDHDLVGYSLGGRTVARMLVDGARPRRAVIAGMGLTGLIATAPRTAHFRHILDNLGSFAKFTPEWNAEAFLKTTHGDPVALKLLLETQTDLTRDQIAAIDTPVLVLNGAEDDDNGSAADLAALLPDATYVEVPGGHMSAVTKPDLGKAIADYLAA